MPPKPISYVLPIRQWAISSTHPEGSLLHVISFCLCDVTLMAGIPFLAPPPNSSSDCSLSLKNGTQVTTEHSCVVTRASTLGHSHGCRRSHSALFPPVTPMLCCLSPSVNLWVKARIHVSLFSVSSRDPEHRTCFQLILFASVKTQKICSVFISSKGDCEYTWSWIWSDVEVISHSYTL